MANVVMPKLGLTMVNGIVVKWFKRGGRSCQKGRAAMLNRNRKNRGRERLQHLVS